MIFLINRQHAVYTEWWANLHSLMSLTAALVAWLFDSCRLGCEWVRAPAGGSSVSSGGLEKLQRETSVPAAEESGAAHPDTLEEIPPEARESGRPHTGRLEDAQTETPIPAAAQGRRHATGRLQGAPGSSAVTTFTFRCFYPKPLALHSRAWFVFMISLGIEPMTLAMS